MAAVDEPEAGLKVKTPFRFPQLDLNNIKRQKAKPKATQVCQGTCNSTIFKLVIADMTDYCTNTANTHNR